MPAPTSNKLHFFAISLLGSSVLSPTLTPSLVVQTIKSTQKWLEDLKGGFRQQIIQVSLLNLSPPASDIAASWITEPHTVELISGGITTTTPGVIHRLRPGDQARLQIGVQNKRGVAAGSEVSVKVVVTSKRTGRIIYASDMINVSAGLVEYTADAQSLSKHQSPDWYDDAKFGKHLLVHLSHDLTHLRDIHPLGCI